MSGTSLDGVDVAYLETDGGQDIHHGPWLSMPYRDKERQLIRRAIDGALAGSGDIDEVVKTAAHVLTRAHERAIEALLLDAGISERDIDLIGFHGQTILHRPDDRKTWQIGLPQMLADGFKTPVVFDFRMADVAAGGQGAPFAPLYHQALCASQRHVMVLNIGGVANLTWVGEGEDDVIAFDTGPGNGLIDLWVQQHDAGHMDMGGRIASAGKVDLGVLEKLMDHPYFAKQPPKSLDRYDFTLDPAQGLSLEDGAATLTAFTVASIAAACDHLPTKPELVVVCGGGRHNPEIMKGLAGGLGCKTVPVEDMGWRGDAIEAEAFAWLAVRARDGRPLSLPGTTGVPKPMTGGVLVEPA